jgi:GWxTD domain-containing protein
MKCFTSIILFCFIFLDKANAQLTAFAKSQVYTFNTSTVVLQHIAVQIPMDQSISIKFHYYKNNVCVDSFTSYCNTTANEYVGNYWHRTIQHQLAPGTYTCKIDVEQSNTQQSWYTQNDINVQAITDSTIILTPIVTFFDSTSNKNIPLIGDFCDTTINYVQVQSKVMLGAAKDSMAYIYLRVTKRGKPNHILFSKVDTIQASITSKQTVYDYTSTIPLNGLKSGNYMVFVSVYRNTTLLKKVETFFQCIRPTIQMATNKASTVDEFTEQLIDFKNTFVGKMDTTALKRNITSLQAIVTASQFNIIQQLVAVNDDTTMRRYFYNFWQVKNNENPESAWREYATKLNYCIDKFGGTNNDRAITYLRYGKPDKTEDVPNEPNTIPYEIWQYEAIGTEDNVVFLFIQGRGIDNQKALLHSTLKAEKQFPNWRNFLIKGEDNNNRALEYLQLNGSSR